MANQKTTTLDSDVTKPSVTAPGDGPHDTTDPLERASTVTAPTPGPEALKSGTVNAVLPLDRIPEPTKVKDPRIEEYDAVKPDGTTVRVIRNIETGESRIKTSTDTGSVSTQNR